MQPTRRPLLPILLTALALAGATLGPSRLSGDDPGRSLGAPAAVAQSTTAILEARAA